MIFSRRADEFRREEHARIAATVTPTLPALRSLTPAPFRVQTALMMERLGHALVNDPSAAEFIVTLKDGRKFITACARPADPTPTGIRDLVRLHQAVLAANAEGGIYVTPHSFTPDAQEWARTMPIIRLVDADLLMHSMRRSMKGITTPQTYRAMCCQCGDIVQHRLHKSELVPCRNGHQVAPTLPKASLIVPCKAPASPSDRTPKPAPRTYSRREIRAHNAKYEARMMRQQQRGG